jgi:dephospho-CoA kinase
MAEPLKRLWKFLNTDIGDLFSAETVQGGVESAKAVLELAKTLKEQGSNVGQLAPLVGRISTLLDVLNSPLIQVVGSGLPFVSIATGLLTFYLDKSKQEPTLALCVALVSQGAYLESLKAILALPENQALLERIGKTPVSEPVEKQIKKLGELELDDAEAQKAVVCFHESKLAEEFNKVLVTRLQQAGLEAAEAEILTQRVAWNTARYINQVIADAADKVKPLAELYRTGGRELLEKYQSLDTYLEEQIASKPLENVFAESFLFKDIYVPLKVKPVDSNGDIDKDAKAFGLEAWAKTMLNDSQKQAQVMFIQGGPGRGKSVFCRMFADWVRQQLHPIWTPILIRLRDIRTFEKNFETTLRAAVNADFAKSDDGWLTDRNTRFLFLLDGFDELLMERRTSEGLKEFLQQVGQFQRDCQQSKEMGHRVLITGRSLALHSIERLMPSNLEQVGIVAMDSELQQQWLSKWEVQVGTEKTSAFKQFLQDWRCPERVQKLAEEPLLLYLLAAMHRDNELTVDLFDGASGTTAKILIYQRSLDWVLTKQRPELLNRELTEQDTEDLRRILTEAGLCVVQSGGECASVTMIEER